MRSSTALLVTLPLLVIPTVYGSNFTDCLNRVRNGELGTGRIGATDNEGRILDDVRNATGLTYELCRHACGEGPEPFKWSDFSQQFSAWLLPYLALISQLPFGPRKRQDNLESIMLTVGSPTLAAYSLALTVLSREWVATRLSRHNYPNLRSAVLVLTSLQQAPLRISDEGDLLASLVVLPQNDRWWGKLNEHLQDPHTWSISAVTSIAWVIIAYAFTVIDSFTGDFVDRMKACGQGVGSVWLWLLPIVIGWHKVSPKCNQERIEDAIHRANQKAHVAAEERSANQRPVLVGTLTERRAIYLAWNQENELRASETNQGDERRVRERTLEDESLDGETNEEDERRARERTQDDELRDGETNNEHKLRVRERRNEEDELWTCERNKENQQRARERNDENELRADEMNTAPIYNYSRFLPWVGSVEKVLGVFRAASYRRINHQSVNSNNVWVDVDPREKPHAINRVGNRRQIERYCSMEGLPLREERSRWGSNVVSRMLIASFMALLLQWGTVGGAIVLIYFTPTVGLGCRSGSYVLFGSLSTLAWMLLVGSSVLSHFATGLVDLQGRPNAGWPRAIAQWFSIALRRLGKVVAGVNAVWIVAICLFQFGNFYNSCYCDSSVLGRGNLTFIVIELVLGEAAKMKGAWVGGTCLAAGTSLIFLGFIGTKINPDFPDELQQAALP